MYMPDKPGSIWVTLAAGGLLRPGSEAEMVALFLRTELASDRFGGDVRALLERDGLPERVVTAPDLGDDTGNQARLRLLTGYRGYATRTEIFGDFPGDVRWQWMAITAAELAAVRYIEYDYWAERDYVIPPGGG